MISGPLEQVNCSSPCWYFSFEVTGVESEYNCPYEDCTDYWLNRYTYVKGTSYFKKSWGGVSTSQVLDFENNPTPSILPEYGYSRNDNTFTCRQT